MFQSHLFRICTVVICLCLFTSIVQSKEKNASDIQWTKHTIAADSDFEAAGIGDLDNDGHADILCGDYWYAGPDFKTRHFVAKHEKLNDYYNDFANETLDVDADGDLDAISATWFSKEIFWKENPGDAGKAWTLHSIDKPGNMETALLADVNGDGITDIYPDCAQICVWYEKPNREKPEWTKHVVGTEGSGHGSGVGDVDGDGVMDILCPRGWYKGHRNGKAMKWEWQFEWNLGAASIPVVSYDVNGDGLNDVIWGMGHNYGLYWMEQSTENGHRMWWRHTIDESWSQAHYIAAVDIDGDGINELIAGKRYHAHNGHDPGGNDPLCIYIYEFDKEKQTWNRIAVDEGTNTGFGLNPAIGDVDGDGDIDLVCPGKSGLYWFEHQ